MDINPLIADLNKHKEELIDSIQIAIGFNELHLADKYVADAIAEIRGEKHSNEPFQQVANLYNLPREEVVKNIRSFANNGYKSLWPGDPRMIKDIEFDSSGTK